MSPSPAGAEHSGRGRAPAGGSGDWVKPNEKPALQGIPPIPASVVQEVARYADFRGHGFVDWHPSQGEMLVSHRKAVAHTTQIYRLPTRSPSPSRSTVRRARIPSASELRAAARRLIVFERSTGGNEAAQLYRLDLATSQTTRHFRAGHAPRPGTAG